MRAGKIIMYILLVSIFWEIKATDIPGSYVAAATLAQSPYDGIAINVKPAGTSSTEGCLDWVDSITPYCGEKHLWPWTTLDEIVSPTYGLDVLDQGGGLTHWLTQWEVAVRKAKEIGTPGVCLDGEPYSNADLLFVDRAASICGLTENQLRTGLNNCGRAMVDITNAIYPNMLLWDRTAETYPIYEGYTYDNYITYDLTQGMLQRLKELDSQIVYLSAANHIGYFQPSLAAFQNMIDRMVTLNAEVVVEYPDIAFGASLMLYDGLAATSGWTQGRLIEDGPPTFTSIEDFWPVLDLYDSTFDYCWIYRDAEEGGSLLANSDEAIRVNNLLRATKYLPRLKTQIANGQVYDSSAALADFRDQLEDGRYVLQDEIL